MTGVIWRAGGLVILVVGLSAAPASAQDPQAAAPVPPLVRWTVEGAAGLVSADGSIQGTGGSLQALAVGFAPIRGLTVLISAERSHIPIKMERDAYGYSAERGGTTRFISGEVRYAFFTDRRVSPFVLGGIGFGSTRQNVNELFPNEVKRQIKADYVGGGARISLQRWLEAFVDARFVVTADDDAQMGVYLPVRAGVAWRF